MDISLNADEVIEEAVDLIAGQIRPDDIQPKVSVAPLRNLSYETMSREELYKILDGFQYDPMFKHIPLPIGYMRSRPQHWNETSMTLDEYNAMEQKEKELVEAKSHDERLDKIKSRLRRKLKDRATNNMINIADLKRRNEDAKGRLLGEKKPAL